MKQQTQLYSTILLLLMCTSCVHTHNVQTYRQQAKSAREKENYALSIEYLQQALELEPNHVETLFELGFSHVNLGQVAQAVSAYQKILQQSPSVSAAYNMSYALKMGGFMKKALAGYRNIIANNPNYETAQFGLGHALLQAGEFEKGWKQHERYLKSSGKNADELRLLLETNTIAGKTVLITPEGGIGDTVQFIRYAELLKNKGAYIIALTQKQLVPLLSLCPYLDEVYYHADFKQICLQYPEKGVFHARSTTMSLPAVFNSNEQTIPKNIPYIHTNEQITEQWRNYFTHDQSFKIGICWQASVANDVSRAPVARRGIPLKQLYDLTRLPNVTLYSLQQYDGLEQLADVPKSIPIHTFDETFDTEHGNFMDTVSVMQQLDLIITVDTATAHLAGALGIPVWLMLPYSTDWRWIVGRSDTPWYPTMRIFKQPKPFDWDSVMTDILWQLTMHLQSLD